jgi:hypothetical protein
MIFLEILMGFILDSLACLLKILIFNIDHIWAQIKAYIEAGEPCECK